MTEHQHDEHSEFHQAADQLRDVVTTEHAQKMSLVGAANSRTLILVLVTIAIIALGVSIHENETAVASNSKAVKIAQSLAEASKKQAAAAQRGVFAARQLICVLERDINRDRDTTSFEQRDLAFYDRQLKCRGALRGPLRPLDLGPGSRTRTTSQSSSPSSSETTPSGQRRATQSPTTTSPAPRRSPRSSPSSKPTRSPGSPHPTPTPSCHVFNPVNGACIRLPAAVAWLQVLASSGSIQLWS